MKKAMQLFILGAVVIWVAGFACNPTPPPPPPTLHQANLSWSPGIPQGLYYNVYRSTEAGGPYTKIATDVVTLSYIDKSVNAGTTYYYVVSAENDAGESAYSNEATTTIPATSAALVKLKFEL